MTDKEQQLSNADNQFRMKCPVCSRQFYVETTSSRIPKHAKNEESEKDPQYTPCGGTGRARNRGRNQNDQIRRTEIAGSLHAQIRRTLMGLTSRSSCGSVHAPVNRCRLGLGEPPFFQVPTGQILTPRRFHAISHVR